MQLRDCNFIRQNETIQSKDFIDSQVREREQERTEDALAFGSEEGRGKLR